MPAHVIQLFSILSFEGTNLDPNFSITLTFVGNLDGGGTVMETFVPTVNLFTAFAFDASWTGLTSVEVTTTGHNGAIDNIHVTPATIPEPATVALLGIGLAGLAARMRRNKAA